jgi:hypothetical protein
MAVKTTGRTRMNDLVWHDLRRTRVVRLRRRGMAKEMIASITGHSLNSIEMMLAVYGPIDPTITANAIVSAMEMPGQKGILKRKLRMILNLLARYWTKVEKRGETDCWIWKGARTVHGYGQIGSATRHNRATRVLATHVALAIDGRRRPGLIVWPCMLVTIHAASTQSIFVGVPMQRT